jgi:hypothetical protein
LTSIEQVPGSTTCSEKQQGNKKVSVRDTPKG